MLDLWIKRLICITNRNIWLFIAWFLWLRLEFLLLRLLITLLIFYSYLEDWTKTMTPVLWNIRLFILTCLTFRKQFMWIQHLHHPNGNRAGKIHEEFLSYIYICIIYCILVIGVELSYFQSTSLHFQLILMKIVIFM